MFSKIISLVDVEMISIYLFFRWSLIKSIFDICWNLMFIKILTINITNSMISTLDVFPYPESSLIVQILEWVFFGYLSHLFPSLSPTLWIYLLFYLWYIHNLIFWVYRLHGNGHSLILKKLHWYLFKAEQEIFWF